MTSIEPIDLIAEDCLSLEILIKEHGTQLMQTLMRLLLLEVAQEIVRTQTDPHRSPSSE